MPRSKPARYEHRQIHEWLKMADEGRIALPSFQRSYVWEKQRIADYLKALFENRPTGIFLTLESQDPLQFVSRTLKGIDADDLTPDELVLDGQQRITSLWNALKGQESHRFYAQVEDLKNRKMNVTDVVFYFKTSSTGRALEVPKTAYTKDFVPIDILYNKADTDDAGNGQDPDEPGKIWDWCQKACGVGGNAGRRLENAIKRLRDKLLRDRDLQYCILPAETDPNVAINIFVETNKSSATIKMFDIVVATAQGSHEEDLRNRILDFHKTNTETMHYFSDEEEKMIPEVGEWLLKVACLKVNLKKYPNGVPPREKNYGIACRSLFRGGKQKGKERLDELERDLQKALKTVAQNGGTTKRTLPAWPPVHVIAALQRDLQAIQKATRQGTANKLISTYLWRAFLTDRYEAQANDRLFEDFVGLRQCLEQIRDAGKFDEPPVIFSDKEHPLPTPDDLAKSLQWIGTGRLGRAVAAVAMERRPRDWVTGEILDVNAIRKLEGERRLDRHHVFPREFLKAHFESAEINHGLNGVLLNKSSNLALWKMDPALYLKKILKDTQGLKEAELRARVESHLVPYDALKSKGSPKSRYKNFIKQRARLVVAEIARLMS